MELALSLQASTPGSPYLIQIFIPAIEETTRSAGSIPIMSTQLLMTSTDMEPTQQGQWLEGMPQAPTSVLPRGQNGSLPKALMTMESVKSLPSIRSSSGFSPQVAIPITLPMSSIAHGPLPKLDVTMSSKRIFKHCGLPVFFHAFLPETTGPHRAAYGALLPTPYLLPWDRPIPPTMSLTSRGGAHPPVMDPSNPISAHLAMA